LVHLVHYSSRPAGIELLLPLIVKTMPDYKFKGFVIRKPVPSEPNVYDFMNIKVIFGGGNFRAFFRMFHYARSKRNHIFHVFNIGPFFLLALRFAGIKKLVYSIHGTIYWKDNFYKILSKILWYIALNRNIKITSNTQYSKNVFNEKINKFSEVQVIYNPVDGNRFTPAVNKKKSPYLKIIYVGRLSNGKNLKLWIDLAVQLHSELPVTQFEIYGMGPLFKTLQYQIESLKANNFIILKGFRQDIENIYKEADLLLFLSEYESAGNVVVESILSETPVIASDIPSMREIFIDFPEFIVKINENIHQEILYKLFAINELKELAVKARKDFLNIFSTDTHTEALHKIYQSLYDL
jgi:glycosyltransferase involved in cell wall biosynthesis